MLKDRFKINLTENLIPQGLMFHFLYFLKHQKLSLVQNATNAQQNDDLSISLDRLIKWHGWIGIILPKIYSRTAENHSAAISFDWYGLQSA